MSQQSEHYTLTANEGEAIWFSGGLATIKASGALTGNALSLVEILHPRAPLRRSTSTTLKTRRSMSLKARLRDHWRPTWSAEAGSFVWLPRGIPHGYTVVGDEPVRTLVITIPSGFAQFVREVGDPAPTRTLPPPAELDVERLVAAATRNGQEILGPLVLP
jgi:hypothetical protein